jgi:serine/threonine protein kinase/tetratricopeptide (TPR) repeat protein
MDSGVRAAGAKIMGDRSNPAKSIFLEAIEKHVPERWPAFLAQACAGDLLLCAEVEKLLRAHAEIGSFHEGTDATLLGTVEHPVTEAPGTVIGPYKLLQQIGEGGMGVVFLAEQEKPVRRRVALKIIKPGMDTAQVIARFEAERQALALMDHPHIARVLDAGATDSGRPYFVMEQVKGVPITEFCDQNRLAPEARLKLFLDVCQAIQHAHQKGIIHRDIKPTNVLVTLHDGLPLVQVIDFGVAKAMGQRLTEKTLFTAHGQMIGTPEYMSPEQAGTTGLDVDTRTDVYGLGVLLYELLTGTTPLAGKGLNVANYAELQRLIREEEPPRPSHRLLSLGDAATVPAGNRSLDVKRLAQLLAGDLDWVVMKALDKDRNRRYDTPGCFVADIERYLRHEPVLARPPSATYKLKKFAQRNRAAVLTATAVAAALLGGLAVATWEALRATQAEAAALVAAGAEKRAKEDALARESEIEAVLDFVENRMFAAARPVGRAGGLGPDVTLRQAVEAALPFVEHSFTKQPLIEARLRLTLGTSFLYLGEGQPAAEQCKAAGALYTKHRGPEHPETLRSRMALANSYYALGRHGEALALCEQTLALQKAQLGPDHADTLTSMSNLANCYVVLGRPADALQLLEEALALGKAKLDPDHSWTLASMNSLATCYYALGRPVDALALYDQTFALRKAKLGPDHPDTLISMSNVAASYGALGRYADALALYQETFALQQIKCGPDHPDTLQTMFNLAVIYAALGRHVEALDLRKLTLARYRAKLGPDHPRSLMCMHNVAWSYSNLGQHAEALRLYEETLALQKLKLGPDHPDTVWSMWGVAYSLVELNRGSEALPLIDECVRRAAGEGVDPSLLPRVMDLRLRHFEKTKDVAGCRQTSEMWEKLKRTDPNSLYDAACMRAVTAAVVRTVDTSPAGGKQADAEADRATAWLKQALAAGFKDATRVMQDKDFDALRDRADFTKLVTQLQAQPSERRPISSLRP